MKLPGGVRCRAVLAGLACGVVLIAACAGRAGEATGPDWLTDRLGGDTTARALRGRPVNQAARNLGFTDLGRFADGAEVFDRHFTVTEGLGPDFEDTGCLGCHHDTPDAGRASDDPPGLLVRTGAVEAGQLRTRAVTGAPEAELVTAWARSAGPEGGSRSGLRRPAFEVTPRDPLPPGTSFSFRMATPIIGMGLLEAIPVADLWAAADPDDADGDGISGRVAVVADPADARLRRVGRFGWKATQPTVAAQTRAALEVDLGIRTAPGEQGPAEIDEEDLADLVLYNRTIAVPAGRIEGDPAAVRGAARFEELGCAACHTPTQRSGPDEVPALAEQTFHPFTDLLLHDLGPGLADDRPDGAAAGSEWRTAPLWGLGRRVEATGRAAFLHDGRARTPLEAVRWHGGEAAPARDRFGALDAAGQADLAAFLAGL